MLPCTGSSFLGCGLSFLEWALGLSTSILLELLLQPSDHPSFMSLGCVNYIILFLSAHLSCPWQDCVLVAIFVAFCRPGSLTATLILLFVAIILPTLLMMFKFHHWTPLFQDPILPRTIREPSSVPASPTGSLGL